MIKQLVAACLVLVPAVAFAEEAATPSASASADRAALTTGTKGLSFGLPAGGGPTAGFTYFLKPDNAIRVDVGLNVPFQPDFGINISLEGGYRMYMPHMGMLYPFVQPGVFIRSAPGGADVFDADRFDFAITGGIGAEYFFTERFSVSGQTGGAFSINAGGDAIALTTGTSALFANMYW